MSIAKLLIVEDDPEWHRIFAEDLDSAGIGYELATSLVEALAAAERVRFDAAMVDLALRGPSVANSDGELVVQALYELHEGTSVVVVSSTVIPENASRMASLLDTPTLDKRSGLPDLADVARIMLGNGRKHRPLPDGPAVQQILRGPLDGITWEWNLQNGLPSGSGDISRIRDFLVALIGPQWPLVQSDPPRALECRAASGLYVNEYWSRGSGQAVGIAIGARDLLAPFRGATPEALTAVFPNFRANLVLDHRDRGKLAGLVVGLDAARSDFASSVPMPNATTTDWLAAAIGKRHRHMR